MFASTVITPRVGSLNFRVRMTKTGSAGCLPFFSCTSGTSRDFHVTITLIPGQTDEKLKALPEYEVSFDLSFSERVSFSEVRVRIQSRLKAISSCLYNDLELFEKYCNRTDKATSEELINKVKVTPNYLDIQAMLVAGFDPHHQNGSQKTALHHAAEKRGSTSLALLLVNFMTRYDLFDEFGNTPLYYAIKNSSRQEIYNSKDKSYVVMHDLELAYALLDRGCPLTKTSKREIDLKELFNGSFPADVVVTPRNLTTPRLGSPRISKTNLKTEYHRTFKEFLGELEEFPGLVVVDSNWNKHENGDANGTELPNSMYNK